MSVETSSSRVIDPTQIGPLDRCLRCFVPRSDRYSYCLGCGHLGAFFAITECPWQVCCKYHSNTVAIAYCSCCTEPICEQCQARCGISLMSGLSTPQCFQCLDEMSKLENGFLARLEQASVCAKHPHETAELRCKSCNLLHCDSCLYFMTKGLFGNRIGDGPFCLPCFRFRTAFSGLRHKWMSACQARMRKLI